MVVVFIDESTPYTALTGSGRMTTFWDEDLRELREWQEANVKIKIVLMVLNGLYGGGQHSPWPAGNRELPEECVGVIRYWEHWSCGDDAFVALTEAFLRPTDEFENEIYPERAVYPQCFGLLVDDSGSTQSRMVLPGLQRWSGNINGESYRFTCRQSRNDPFPDKISTGMPCEFYMYPLELCTDPPPGYPASAQGTCYHFSYFYDERWLRGAKQLANEMYNRGCQAEHESFYYRGDFDVPYGYSAQTGLDGEDCNDIT